MNWYYVEDNERKGPFDDAEFEKLVESGCVTAKTLIWQSGMAEWQPYGVVHPEFAARESVDLSNRKTAYCANCRGHFEVSCMKQCGDLFVCGNCLPTFQQVFAAEGQGGVAHPQMEYAGLGVRAAAFFADMLAFYPIYWLISLPFMSSTLPLQQKLIDNPGMLPSIEELMPVLKIALLVSVLQMLGALCCYVLFLGRFGATPGKMLCGLRVVRPDGTRVSYMQAFGRFFGVMLSCLTLGFLTAAFDAEKRALHDTMCGTRVVRKPSPPEDR